MLLWLLASGVGLVPLAAAKGFGGRAAIVFGPPNGIALLALRTQFFFFRRNGQVEEVRVLNFYEKFQAWPQQIVFLALII
jgi:hypothetical protein